MQPNDGLIISCLKRLFTHSLDSVSHFSSSPACLLGISLSLPGSRDGVLTGVGASLLYKVCEISVSECAGARDMYGRYSDVQGGWADWRGGGDICGCGWVSVWSVMAYVLGGVDS